MSARLDAAAVVYNALSCPNRHRAMIQPNLILLVAAPLIMWRVYKRVQRLTVRQRSRTWRHWVGAIAFPLIVAGIAVTVHDKPVTLGAIAGGLALGVVLGMLALRRTGFESSGDQHYYTPYAPIGLFIAMLFIARLLYRGVEMVNYGPAHTPQLGSSPLTMFIFATVAGYYHAYSTGLLRWRRTTITW